MFKLISTVDSLLTNTSVKRTPTVGPSLSRSLLLVDSVCNTRLLCAALNVSWRDYISNKELYGDLSPISTSLQIRRLQFSGHCWRSKNETVSQLLLLDPKHDRRSRGAQQQHLLINQRVTAVFRGRILHLSWPPEGNGTDLIRPK